MMYLNNRQLTLLLFPFIAATLTYYFSDEIVQNIKYFFPTYEKYRDKNLNNKASIYLAIDSKKETYMKLMKDMKDRYKNPQWIVDDLLYLEASEKDSNEIVMQESAKVATSELLTLQMTLPKKNIAIISDKIVKLNGTILKAKLISVENRRVLLQYKEKQRWLYMFK